MNLLASDEKFELLRQLGDPNKCCPDAPMTFHVFSQGETYVHRIGRPGGLVTASRRLLKNGGVG